MTAKKAAITLGSYLQFLVPWQAYMLSFKNGKIEFVQPRHLEFGERNI